MITFIGLPRSLVRFRARSASRRQFLCHADAIGISLPLDHVRALKQMTSLKISATAAHIHRGNRCARHALFGPPRFFCRPKFHSISIIIKALETRHLETRRQAGACGRDNTLLKAKLPKLSYPQPRCNMADRIPVGVLLFLTFMFSNPRP
mgnify:FL=1